MKIMLMRKQSIAVAAAVCILLAGVLAVSFVDRAAVVNNNINGRELPVYRVQRDDNKIAISFDAAWGNEDTQDLINILEKYDVKATFFVVGDWVDKYPESVKALSDAGHEVMNHSNTHPHMPSLSKEDMIKEVNACSEKIMKITGTKPILFRPPYGDYDNNVISTLFDNGYYSIQWDVDSLDWKELSAQEITDRVMKDVKSGSIVLFHNAALHTPEALPGIIEGLKGKGYEFVKVSELIYKEGYNMTPAGEQYMPSSDADEIPKSEV